jgi:hypothetical protein
MGDIGIGIKVDSSQLEAARKLIKSTAELLTNTFDKPYSFNFSGTGLKGFGGKPSVEAGQMDRVYRSASQYRREMSAASEATAKIVKDYDKLIKVADTLKHTTAAIPGISSVSSAESLRMRRESKRDADSFWNTATSPKRQTAAEKYFSIHGNYGRTVTSQDGTATPSGAGGSMLPGLMSVAKGAGLLALGWAGVSSVSGVLTNAKDRAREYADRDLPLRLRGVTIADESLERMATKYGIRPGQTQAAVEILSRTTGRRDVSSLLETLATRSLATSATPSELAGYIGGAFPHVQDATNGTGSNINRLLSQGLLLGRNTGRYHELFGSFQNVLSTGTGLRGGTPLDNSSAASLAALMGLMWNSGDKTLQGASGANLLNQIGAGIASGGSTPGAQMFLAQALGVEGVNSMSDAWGFQKKMRSGANVDNIRSVVEYSRKIAAQRGLTGADADVFAKMNLRDSLGLTEYQVDSVMSKDFSGNLTDPTGKLAGRVSADQKGIRAFLNTDLKGNLGFNAAVADATDEFQQAKIYGDELLKFATTLKNAKTGVGNAGRTTRGKQYANMTDAEIQEAARQAGAPGSTTAGSDYYAIQQEARKRQLSDIESVKLEGTDSLELAIKDLTTETRKANAGRWRKK